jgi:hypothetical protein
VVRHPGDERIAACRTAADGELTWVEQRDRRLVAIKNLDPAWSCNDADGSSACDRAQGVCTATACCDPAEQPGVGGRPCCTEGATCCASGSWSCNDADGSTYCDDVGSVCLPLSAIRFADQG